MKIVIFFQDSLINTKYKRAAFTVLSVNEYTPFEK